MPLAGKHLSPRNIAVAGAPHWHGRELVKMVATVGSESLGYIGAWHDNVDNAGKTTSRDCGLMQISIPFRQVGTGTEWSLRTESKEEAEWQKVLKLNVLTGYKLYEQPWTLGDIRRWQPWHGYTSGWATFPEWWIWHQDADHNPTGPWMPTGRYLMRAISGVANYHLLVKKDMTEKQAIDWAILEAAHWGIQGMIGIRGGYIGWSAFPTKPVKPPKDGIGPRPVQNEGI